MSYRAPYRGAPYCAPFWKSCQPLSYCSLDLSWKVMNCKDSILMDDRPAVALGATVEKWELEAKGKMGAPRVSGKAGGNRRGSQDQLLARPGQASSG